MTPAAGKLDEARGRAAQAVASLREPDPSLARVVNTVRQSIADIIEEQQKQIDRYGLALMMIGEGADDPRQFAKDTLSKHQLTAAPAPEAGGDAIERAERYLAENAAESGADEIIRQLMAVIRASPSAGAEAMREALEPFAYIGAALEQAGKESWPDGASAKYMALEGLFARDFRHAHAVFSALPTAPTESQSAQVAARASKSDLLRWRGAFRKNRSEDTEEDW